MDGAMGTSLFAKGISRDACLEELNETRPDLISEIHRAFIAAGAQVLVTNTFGANRTRLGTKADRLKHLNQRGVRIAREVAGVKAKVFASIGPGGDKGQAAVLEKEHPDGYLVETMTSLAEAEAAAKAVREVSDRLLIVSLTGGVQSFEPLRKTCEVLRKAGADVIGFNCGKHPKEAYEFLSALKEVDPGPWLARPAGGLPNRIVSPEEFAEWGRKIASLGVTYLGGCCGTTPGHIRALLLQ